MSNSKLDMTPSAIRERLRRVAAISDLHSSRRLDAKLDMSARGVSRRLREAAELLELSQRLARAKRSLEP